MQYKVLKQSKYYMLFSLGMIFMGYSLDSFALPYPTKAEIIYLPPYCQARLSAKVPLAKKKRWEQILGRKVWVDFHHYCQKINYENRYYGTTNPKERIKLLQETESGLLRKLKQYGPNFVLKHNGYYRVGWAQQKQGKNAAAISSFEKAVKIKPKYARAYASLSDLYKDLGQFKKALEVINRGLEYSPNSKGLKKRKHALEKR